MLDNKFTPLPAKLEETNIAYNTMGKFIQAALKYTEYNKKPRTYGTDDLLYMSEAHFMQAVSRLENPEIGEIAKSLGITSGAASQTAKKLEDKGLIIRRKSDVDSRIVLCRLTEKGEAINAFHEKLDEQEFMMLANNLARFSAEDMGKIYEFLHLTVEFFEKGLK